MNNFERPSHALPPPSTVPKLLPPSISYHLRKLLRQNFDQLIALDESGINQLDALDDFNGFLMHRYGRADACAATVDQLERLSMLHQTLSRHGVQHLQQLQETERQIFALLGYQLQPTLHQDTLLIISDAEEDLRSLIAALEGNQYCVISIVGGLAGLRAVQTLKPDLVLINVLISGADDYEVCSQIQSNPLTQDIPVVFLSARNDAQSKVKAFEVGGVDYITKPFQVEEVMVRVAHQLRLRSLQKRLEEQNVRMQQEMQEHQEIDARFRSIFENSIDGIFQATPAGRFISVNPALAKIYGYGTPHELMTSITNIGQQLYVQPGQRDIINAYLRKDGQVTDAVSEIYRRDGSKIWISENIRAVRDNGNVIYYEGTVRDITINRQLEAELRHQKKKADGLLVSMLPRSVAERLKRQREAIADNFADVTVLFADIENFSALSSRLTPNQQVNLLNHLFSQFDELVEQYKLEKIKTVRDLYVVAGGLPEPMPNHAEAIADLAIAMQSTAEAFQAQLGEPFQIRIGISTGAVVAGIIGKRKLTYDIWGDTVNLAIRMQAQGEPGKIQVTPATYHRLQHSFRFEERGLLNILGLGTMMTHWLLDRGAG